MPINLTNVSTFAFSKGSRQTRVKGIVGEKHDSLPDAALGGPVKPVQNLLTLIW